MFDYYKKIFDNGFRLVFVPTGSPSVAVRLVVGAGSKNETRDILGLAHFLEHMAFKGTRKRSDPTLLKRQLESIGAFYDAGTGKETTSYAIKSTADKLELMLDLISDITFNDYFKKEDVAKEKGVIIEEYRMYQDDPTDKVDDLFEETILGKTDLGRKIIGTKETILAADIEKFIDFKRSFYQPSNMVLAVAGGLLKKDWLKVQNLIEKYFGKVENQPVVKKTVSFKKMFGKTKIEQDNTEQTHMIFGLPIFGNSNPARWPLAILRTVLVGNTISRLWIKIREQRGWAYYIYPYSYFYQEAGIFAVKFGIRNDVVVKAKEIIVEEMSSFSKTLNQPEIDDAKGYFRGNFLRSLENPLRVAKYVSSSWLLEDEMRTLEQSLEMINQVSLDQVKKLAQKILIPEKFSLVAIGPKKLV